MTITLELTSDMEQKLRDIAQGQTSEAQTVAQELIAQISQMPSEVSPSEKTPRIPGLNRGSVLWISDDFDDPLPDSFWFGEDDEESKEGAGKIA